MTSIPAEPAAVGAPGTSPMSRNALIALGVGFAACFLLLLVNIKNLFGLPAHPLLLHVPVVFDPLLAMVTLVLVARPELRRRYAVLWAAFAVVSLAATVLTAGAGQEFLDTKPRIDATLRDHKEAGETLRTIMFVFTGAILVLVTLDWLGRAGALPSVVAVVVAALAIGAGFFTIRAGHLGAKSAWGREGDRRPPFAFPGGGDGGPPPGY